MSAKKLSDLIPKDDKERTQLSDGMKLQIFNAKIIKGSKWDTTHIDAKTPKGKEIYLYTTSAVIASIIEKILILHKPTEEEPVECECKLIHSLENPDRDYLTLE